MTFYVEEQGLWFPQPGSFEFKADLFVGKAMGKNVLKCERCKKVAFRTKDEATNTAVRIKSWKQLRPYLDPKCSWWHLTSLRGTEWHLDYMAAKMAKPITLWDYQDASVDNLWAYFQQNTGNPVIALPTGTGKSLVIAEFTKRACTMFPGTRVMMLTHVKELIQQNMDALLSIWPTAPAGIYSAGLGRRDHLNDIIFAGIQSVHGKADIFGHIDLVLVDECHLVSPRAESMYGKFIEALTEANPHLKVIGFSATPFRMKQGMLTDEGGMFTDLAFDMTSKEAFNWLISQGRISRLVPRQMAAELDITGVKIAGGEFVLKDLQAKVDHDEITIAALRETVNLAVDRKHWLVFASGIDHANHIAEFLESEFDITAAAVHSKLGDEERNCIIKDFKNGKIQALVNNNILTTGFDFPAIDCIVMLRPTASPGLWVQMLGRGTRPVYADGFDLDTPEGRVAAIAAGPKPNCLALDFAGNTRRLGPINDPVLPRKRGRKGAGMAPVRLCEHCQCYSHASCRFCENPMCGEEFPKNVKIFSQASVQDIIADNMPDMMDYKVTQVVYRVHEKEGRPDSMRVDYYCGLRRFSEYICLDHGGYATRVAEAWWKMRCPWGIPPSVADGMLAINNLKVPTEITVAEKGRYPEICGYGFDNG